MVNQLSILLYHLLQDLSEKQSFLISPDVIALFTSNLLQLLPRAVMNSAAWIQVVLELSFLLVARFYSWLRWTPTRKLPFLQRSRF